VVGGALCISHTIDSKEPTTPICSPDELQAAIDRAQAKRKELENQQPAVQASAKVLAMLPRAADLYRRQIAQGVDGNPREALRARVFLREWSNGKIRLVPLPDGRLMAHRNENEAALLRCAPQKLRAAHAGANEYS
jgi:site-specific DNA recombinase